MLASVLSTPVAVAASVRVVRVFVRLRELLAGHRELARQLADLERKYDTQFGAVFDAIRKLMDSPPREKRDRIGFQKNEDLQSPPS